MNRPQRAMTVMEQVALTTLGAQLTGCREHEERSAIRAAVAIVALSIIVLQVGCDSRPGTGTTAPALAASGTGGTSLRTKAESGDVDAMLQLGRALTSGTNGERKDEFEAFKWLLRAAQAGSQTAMGEVARRYREGRGTRENWESSVQWADKGAEKGDPESLYLSTIRGPFDLFLGWESVIDSESEEARVVRDAASELARMTRAAEGGSIDAKVRLGAMLRKGVWYEMKGKRKAATPPDAAVAQRLLIEASNSGSAIATLYLAQWNQVGGDGIKASTDDASKHWDKVDAIDVASEQYAIGHRLTPGQKKDYKPVVWRERHLTFSEVAWKAKEWLEKAARQGHSQSALELANMLNSDLYGFSDETAAFKYQLQAADAGLLGGQSGVAWSYFRGIGVAKDYSKAYAWALKGATHPTATASEMAGIQRFTAYLLSQGLGVDRDPVLAYAWANVSAASGEKEAKELLARLDQTLGASSIREAQQLSSAWRLGDEMKRLGSSSGSGPSASASAASSGAELKLAGAGTGFFISGNGTLITNYHVAGKCAEVRLPALAKKAAVLAADAANDLTALRVDGAPEASARLADPTKVKQGQEIVAFGFPLEGYLPSAGNVTTGLISALSGPANNTSLIQISTPVQQGSSGGPVMDLKGEVVGVVVGKADVIRIAKATGDILQNVNFAVSAATLQAFLDANRLEYKKSSYFSMTQKPDALVDGARTFTAKVECWR